MAAGTHRAREFGRLLVAARVLFQDESVLQAGIGGIGLLSASSSTSTSTHKPISGSTPGTPSKHNHNHNNNGSNGNGSSGAVVARTGTGNNKTGIRSGSAGAGADLAALLPLTPRLLLIAAYLASHNVPRHDQTLFSTWHHGHKKRRRGGGRSQGAGAGTASNRAGTKHQHRRIARKLLGPGAFVLERMVAIYVATRGEWVDDDDDDDGGREGGVDGDVGMAIATLASLRLLVRVGGGGGGAAGGAGAGGGGGGGGGADLDRGGKWRVNVGWEVIRALGRSMNIEVEEWLID